MDREELNELLKKGPLVIHMNDGNSYEVPSHEHASVSDISAAVLYRANDGKLKHIHLPLVTMSGVEPMPTE